MAYTRALYNPQPTMLKDTCCLRDDANRVDDRAIKLLREMKDLRFRSSLFPRYSEQR